MSEATSGGFLDCGGPAYRWVHAGYSLPMQWALFRDALDEAVVNEIRAATNGGFVLGAARFQQKIAAMLGRRVTAGQAGRPPRKDTERAGAGPNRLQARPVRDGGRQRKNH